MGQTWLNVTSSDVMLLSTFLLCDVVVHDAVGSIVVVYDEEKKPLKPTIGETQKILILQVVLHQHNFG